MDALTGAHREFIALIEDMGAVCDKLGLRWYVWGGMVADIIEGRFLREHGDLDGFVEDLAANHEQLCSALTERGYEVSFDERFLMLKLVRGSIHAGFNPLRINGAIAEWKHIGDQGSVFFPLHWLDNEPRRFCGAAVRTSGIRFEYMLRTNITLLNPQWNTPRPKDVEALAYYREALAREGIDPESLAPWFFTYNPFWYHLGYEDFFLPKFPADKTANTEALFD